ncbi:MAG: hypothetical protein MZV63_59720 [Marinilabiliales bacterium]|nr:hypothetical protein [Marinilabiliales bacterium]
MLVEVPKNSEPQSSVAMVWKDDFKWTIEDRQAIHDANADPVNIKCRESMREDQGGVYGVSVNGSASRYPETGIYNSGLHGAAIRKILRSFQQLYLHEMDTMKTDRTYRRWI